MLLLIEYLFYMYYQLIQFVISLELVQVIFKELTAQEVQLIPLIINNLPLLNGNLIKSILY